MVLKILFIGGTGSISTDCVKELLSTGHEVWVLNRGSRIDRLPKEVHFIKADYWIDGESVLRNQSWDCVINCIVFFPEQAGRDIRFFSSRTKQYIFISTASVYKETNKIITEKATVEKGIWDYANQRLLCEEVYLKAYQSDDFPITIVRPNQTYSEFTIPTNVPGLGYGLIRQFMENKPIFIHNDGRSLWTITHSRDFARCFSSLVGESRAIGEVFNITSDQSQTWNNFFRTYANVLGVEPTYFYVDSIFVAQFDYALGMSLLEDKDKSRTFDNSKIKGFMKVSKIDISFEDGIRESIEWTRKNPSKVFYSQDAMSKVQSLYEWAKRLPKKLQKTAYI